VPRVVTLDEPAELLPMALRRVHTATLVDDQIEIRIDNPPPPDRYPLADLLTGAGFSPRGPEPVTASGAPATVAARRDRTLADTVGPQMTVLFCGFNPSLHAADSGIAYSGPGNRFWPVMSAAGFAGADRDPAVALAQHGVGLTDLCKRATPRAADLTRTELGHGLRRVEALVTWLQPAVVCMVGLGGWRTAVDRHAPTGFQQQQLGGTAVYLMPSTSGLNAGTSLDELTEHVQAALSAARPPASGYGRGRDRR
jgi:double-stranded uracil-DNA glycosylase